MRTFLITTLIIAAGIFMSANVSAQAGVTADASTTLFTFAGGSMNIEYTTNEALISNYMSEIHGSRIIVTDAEVRDNQDGDYPRWDGRSNYDNFLRVTGSDDMEMLFLDTPIIRACGDGYVFDETSGHDFHVRGYDYRYGSTESPRSISHVGTQHIETNGGGEIDFDITFSRPVSLLVFSDGGTEDVGIDNLCVQAVPTPGAMLLGSLGMGITSWLKRRRTL